MINQSPLNRKRMTRKETAITTITATVNTAFNVDVPVSVGEKIPNSTATKVNTTTKTIIPATNSSFLRKNPNPPKILSLISLTSNELEVGSYNAFGFQEGGHK